MHLDLTDEQAAALERELTAIIDGDRYFLSPRTQTLRFLTFNDLWHFVGSANTGISNAGADQFSFNLALKWTP